MNNEQDYVIVWEALKITSPEFRLYYDDNGKVITYTCEKLEGNYIVIDTQTYAEARYDIRIIDGKISRVQPNNVVYKLMPNKNEGTRCSVEDISIVVNNDYNGNVLNWKLTNYEL